MAKAAVKDEAETTETQVTFKDAMHEMAYKQLADLTKKRNALVGRANAAHGDRVTLTEQITEESTDPEIVKAREARDEAIMLLHKLVTPQVDEVMADAKSSIDGIEKELKDLDTTLKPGLTYLKKMYGEEAVNGLPKMARLQGLRISGGGGGRRIRGFHVEVTADGEETVTFDNFAGAAKYLDVETSVLQEAFFTAAGNPEKIKDAPDEVDFEITYTEVDDDENTTEKKASLSAFRPDAEANESEDSED